MTDRHTADSINDDDLDQLYADLARARAEANAWGEAESADVAAGSYAGRVEELQNTIDRVRALRDKWLLMTLEPGQVRRLLDQLTNAIDGEQQ